MKQTLLQETYPIFSLEVDKSETPFQTTDEIIAFLKQRVDEHEVARYIATFDHYSHTKELKDGQVSSDILDAKNIMFCFGITLPNPQVLALRPRSIGVAETENSFILSFMEAPMPVANVAMETWVMAVQKEHKAQLTA
jgi:hypothetical protein